MEWDSSPNLDYSCFVTPQRVMWWTVKTAINIQDKFTVCAEVQV